MTQAIGKKEKTPRQVMPEQEPHVRRRNFDEVPLGYTVEQAQEEAGRCIFAHRHVDVVIDSSTTPTGLGDGGHQPRSIGLNINNLPIASSSIQDLGGPACRFSLIQFSFVS